MCKSITKKETLVVNKERYVVPCSDAAGYASTTQNEKGKQAQFINKPTIIRLVL